MPKLTWDVTLNGESATATVYEDTTADGNADNSESVTLTDGTGEQDLSTLTNTGDWWVEVDFTSTTTGSKPVVNTLTVQVTAPSNLSVDSVTSDTIDISWNDDGSAYDVYRAQSSGSVAADYTKIADSASASYSDTGLENGERYFYVVTYDGKTEISNEVASTTTLPAPGGLTLDASTEDEISLTWNNSDNSTDGTLEVERSEDDSSYSSVYTASSLSETSYTDTGLEDGELYYYRIVRTTDHDSSSSSQSSATTVLPAASEFTAMRGAEGEVDFVWTRNDDSTDGDWKIYQSKVDKSGSQVQTGIPPATTSYTLTGLEHGQQYQFEIERETDHAAAVSNRDSVITTITAPAASYDTSTADQVGVSLTDSINNGGYRVNWWETGSADEPTVVSAINVGGSEYTASDGTVYQADPSTQGSTYSTTSSISGTTDDELYQTERYNSNLYYDISVPSSGLYEVEVMFAELYHGIGGNGGGVGSRIFNAAAEGKAILSEYDIYADVGSLAAVSFTVDVEVTDGTLNLDFRSMVDNVKLSAIKVTQINGSELYSDTKLLATGETNVGETWSVGSNASMSTVLNPGHVNLSRQATVDSTSGDTFTRDLTFSPSSALDISGYDTIDFWYMSSEAISGSHFLTLGDGSSTFEGYDYSAQVTDGEPDLISIDISQFSSVDTTDITSFIWQATGASVGHERYVDNLFVEKTRTTTGTITGLTDGNEYDIRVSAETEYATDSRIDSAVTLVPKPTDLTASFNADNDIDMEVALSWTDQTSGEDNFTLQINRNDQGWYDVDRSEGDHIIPADTTSTTVSPVETGGSTHDTTREVGADSKLEFRLRAELDSNSSDWTYSNILYSKPAVPYDISTTRNSSEEIVLSWTANSNVAGGTEIQYREDTGSGYGSWIEQIEYSWYDSFDYYNANSHPLTEAEMAEYFDDSNTGVTYQASGAWTSPVVAFNLYDYDKPDFLPGNGYSLELDGTFYAPEDGTYTFAVDSDDASELQINNTVVATWYGGHATSNDWTHNGTITLTEGWHDIRVRMTQGSGGDGLAVGMQLPSESATSVMNLYQQNSATINVDDFIQNNARYQFRLRSVCKDYDTSDWIYHDWGNEDVIFEDSFDSGDLSAWDTVNNNGAMSVLTTLDEDFADQNPADGTHAVQIGDGSSVIKNLGDLTSYNNVVVFFKWQNASNDTSDETNTIQWYDGTSWQTILEVGWTWDATGWHEAAIPLNNSLLSSDNRFRIDGISGAGQDWIAVDEVRIGEHVHEYTAPTAPTALSLTTPTDREIDVTWTDNAVFEDEYKVLHKLTTDGTYTSTDLAADVESYTITGLIDGESYNVASRAVVHQYRHGIYTNNWGRSGSVNIVTTNLPQPSNVSIDNSVEDELTLSWQIDDNNSNGDVHIEKDESGTPSTDISGSLAKTTTTYNDTGLEDGELYYYKIVRTVPDTSSETVESQVTLLPAASGSTSDTTLVGEVDLAWTRNDDSSDGDWKIYRSTDSSVGTEINSQSISDTDFTDTTMDTGTEYTYTIRRETDHTYADHEIDVRSGGISGPKTYMSWHSDDDWDNNQSDTGMIHDDRFDASQMRLGFPVDFDGMLAHYGFESNDGTLYDTVGDNHGTVLADINYDQAGVNGSGAWRFTGTDNSRVDIPNLGIYGNQSVTMIVTFYPYDTSGEKMLIVFGGDDDGEQLGVTAKANCDGYYHSTGTANSADNEYVEVSTSSFTEQWTQVILTYDADAQERRLYHNGSLVNTYSEPSPLILQNHRYRIGSAEFNRTTSSGVIHECDAKIADAAWLNTAADASMAQELWDSLTSGSFKTSQRNI